MRCGRPAPLAVHTELCRSQVAAFEAALAVGRGPDVACTQEAPLFREVAEREGERGEPRLHQHPRAGRLVLRPRRRPCRRWRRCWPRPRTSPGRRASPRSSRRACASSTGAARRRSTWPAELAGRLSVTVLLSDPEEALPPGIVSVPIYKGRIRKATGHLGRFEVEVDGYAPMLPSSKSSARVRDAAQRRALHLRHHPRHVGRHAAVRRRAAPRRLLQADPNHPAAVARAMLKVTDLVGEFEKPLYVSYDAGICAHARSQKVGCTNCLDNCPTGAITPDGDHVAIDPAVCGGCGNCSAVCPTGAVSYAYPQRGDLVARLGILIETYRKAGGTRPVVLFHDEKHGSPLISAMARLGRGLPPNVLPLSLFSVLQLGHEALAAALAFGAEHIVLLAPPEHPAELAGDREPDRADGGVPHGPRLQGPARARGRRARSRRGRGLLYDLPPLPASVPGAFAPIGSKRDIARTALAKLKAAAPAPADVIQLPAGSPYGRIQVDIAGCTLCLACVGACPTAALSDNPERPQLAFTEAACVQCGVCVATCPEKVITARAALQFLARRHEPRGRQGRGAVPLRQLRQAVRHQVDHGARAGAAQGQARHVPDRCAAAPDPDVRHLPYRHRGRGGQRPIRAAPRAPRTHHRRLPGRRRRRQKGQDARGFHELSRSPRRHQIVTRVARRGPPPCAISGLLPMAGADSRAHLYRQGCSNRVGSL